MIVSAWVVLLSARPVSAFLLAPPWAALRRGPGPTCMARRPMACEVSEAPETLLKSWEELQRLSGPVPDRTIEGRRLLCTPSDAQ